MVRRGECKSERAEIDLAEKDLAEIGHREELGTGWDRNRDRQMEGEDCKYHD